MSDHIAEKSRRDIARQVSKLLHDLGDPEPPLRLELVRELLKLWSDRRRSSARVKDLALAHIAELEDRRMELDTIIRTLRDLAHACGGDDRPDCPIIEDLQSGGPESVRRAGASRARARI